MSTTITGTAALEYAARTGAQLYKHADPVDGAREITVDEARAIAREDAGLVWCKRTMTAAEQGEHDAEQRAHEALADQGDGGEWQSEDDATSGWGDYAATAASHLDVPADERAAWCDAYETAARETARRLYFAALYVSHKGSHVDLEDARECARRHAEATMGEGIVFNARGERVALYRWNTDRSMGDVGVIELNP